jgi:hypothetical protein
VEKIILISQNGPQIGNNIILEIPLNPAPGSFLGLKSQLAQSITSFFLTALPFLLDVVNNHDSIAPPAFLLLQHKRFRLGHKK